MTREDKLNYSKALLENARQCIRTAHNNVEFGDYKAAANRSYYAIFHSMRAVLMLEEENLQQSKHSGVIAVFRQRYIKEGIFSKEHSRTISDAFEIRNEADYDVSYIISKESVVEQIKRAEEFLKAVESYLVQKGVQLS